MCYANEAHCTVMISQNTTHQIEIFSTNIVVLWTKRPYFPTATYILVGWIGARSSELLANCTMLRLCCSWYQSVSSVYVYVSVCACVWVYTYTPSLDILYSTTIRVYAQRSSVVSSLPHLLFLLSHNSYEHSAHTIRRNIQNAQEREYVRFEFINRSEINTSGSYVVFWKTELPSKILNNCLLYFCAYFATIEKYRRSRWNIPHSICSVFLLRFWHKHSIRTPAFMWYGCAIRSCTPKLSVYSFIVIIDEYTAMIHRNGRMKNIERNR